MREKQYGRGGVCVSVCCVYVCAVCVCVGGGGVGGGGMEGTLTSFSQAAHLKKTIFSKQKSHIR